MQLLLCLSDTCHLKLSENREERNGAVRVKLMRWKVSQKVMAKGKD